MSGAIQAVFMNQRSFELKIGDSYQGGYYAGVISTSGNGVATHRLVVAPKSSGQSDSKQWKTSQTGDSGLSSTINGPGNSALMNSATYPAAQFCEQLTIGGYSDWYMPAKDELEVCFYNLKPTTQNNDTSSGSNSYSVPSRSNYTTSVPAQTSATIFKEYEAEAFDLGAYWSSSEINNSLYAWHAYFTDGRQRYLSFDKTASRRVRAVRRVAI